MGTSSRFIPPDGRPYDVALAGLPARYTLDEVESTAACTTIYDTFDWRLFRKGYALFVSATGVDLLPLALGKPARHAGGHLVPRWAADLPDPELRAAVVPMVGVRALLPVAEGEVASTAWRVRNREDKVVARLDLQLAQPCRAATQAAASGQLVLHEVKGYDKDRKRLAAALSAAGWQETREDAVYAGLLALNGRAPGDYSGDLNLQLDPSMRSDEAVKAILRRLWAMMRANEPFVMQDVDVEFLHDYRIAIRRTRSVLGQLGQVLDAGMVERFRENFAAMGQASNRLRDLDVYLLRRQEYTGMLPPELRRDIGPLFDYLLSQRAGALAEIVAELESPARAPMALEWEAFLREPCGQGPEIDGAGRPILDLAQQRIWKRYRRIRKAGNQLLRGEVDEAELHALRIEFKKLRYLLEFFESLFPGKPFKRLLSQLKNVQDILGEINDVRMQETYLEQVVMELPVASARDRATIRAVGCLVGKLDDRNEATKQRFAPVFAVFGSPETGAQFRELIARAGQAREDDIP